jgi:hypothetical protein
MTRSALATLAAVTGVLALACSEQRPHSPEAPMQAVTSAAPSLACDFNELRRAVARYFAPGDQQTAFDLLKAMQAAGANTTAANAPGFSLLRLVEVVNDGGRAQGTLADGSDVSNRTLACMSVGSPALPISFVVALGPTGLDGVRGGDPATDQAPVFSHDCQFGIQPPAAGWTAAMDGPHLFYGGPTAEFRTERQVGEPFDISAIPVITAFGAGPVVATRTSAEVVGRGRIEQFHGSASILQRANPDFLFFSCPFLAFGRGPGAPLALMGRLAAAGLDLFAPSPLFAATAMFHAGAGGTLVGFSRFGGVDAGAVHLDFLTPPRDAKAGQPISFPPGVRVRARGDGGTPLPEVSVTITVQGNQGSFTLSGTTTRVTGSDGIATFPDLSLDKPGGYVFLATSTLIGFAPSQVSSGLFHITF